jgi:hypothetical protein
MNPENPFYSVSLGVASLQVDSVGVATALSPVSAGHFKFLLVNSIVGLGLSLSKPRSKELTSSCCSILERDVLVTWVETAQAATNISIKPVMKILNAQCLRIIVVSPPVGLVPINLPQVVRTANARK